MAPLALHKHQRGRTGDLIVARRCRVPSASDDERRDDDNLLEDDRKAADA